MKLAAEMIIDRMRESVEEVFITMLSTVAVLIETDPTAARSDDADRIDLEAVVEFAGEPSGAIILRASSHLATDRARQLLAGERDTLVGLEEVQDALAECAGTLAGLLKTRALDPGGSDCLELHPSGTDTKIHSEHDHPGGRLVFELSEGNIAAEIRLDEEL